MHLCRGVGDAQCKVRTFLSSHSSSFSLPAPRSRAAHGLKLLSSFRCQLEREQVSPSTCTTRRVRAGPVPCGAGTAVGLETAAAALALTSVSPAALAQSLSFLTMNSELGAPVILSPTGRGREALRNLPKVNARIE